MKRRIQLVVSLSVGAVLVWLFTRHTDWSSVYESMMTAHPWWLAATQIPIWASFFTRAKRWGYIVRTARPVSFKTLFNATQIGFLANFTLPFRAGEVVRAYVLARRAGIHLSRCFAFVALDRVTDLFGLLGCVTITLLAFRGKGDIVLPRGSVGNAEVITIPGNVIQSGSIGIATILAVFVLSLVVLYANQRWFLALSDRILVRISSKLAHIVHTLLAQFAEGLHVFRSARDMAKSIFWSMATWGLFAASGMCILEAFGYTYPWYTPFLLVTLLAVVVSLPGAPGFVGQFHLAIVVSLLMVMPDSDISQAKAAAIVLHLANFLAVVVAGVAGLAMENTGLLTLTRESEREAQTEAAAESLE